MADSEFEEFRQIFDKLPTRLKTSTVPFYSLVPGLEELDSHSSKSDSCPSDVDEDEDNRSITPQNVIQSAHLQTIPRLLDNTTGALSQTSSNSEDDEIGDGLRTTYHQKAAANHLPLNHDQIELQFPDKTGVAVSHERELNQSSSVQQYSPVHGGSGGDNKQQPSTGQTGERRRRKLPEIPKNKKPASLLLLCGQTSLAEELSGSGMRFPNSACPQPTSRSVLAMKCGYLLDEDSSPDSDRLHSFGDVDSGHSTAHSPTDFKSISPSQSPFPPPFGGVPYSQLEMLEATHRSLHKFIPRHQDEVELEIGDPVYVQKEADDLWCEGVNLRTGKQGVFPSAYAVDLDYTEFDPESVKMKRERYLLGYMGSVETLAHKGTGVVCQAVKKIIGNSGESPKAQSCILEISDQGLRMVERSRLQNSSAMGSAAAAAQRKGPCIDYFYSLKNVSFCAFHPRDHRYIGFITKHPTGQRFACHVFKGQESTRPVAEAVGRAFQRFYQQFIETAYPIEDIYIE